MVIPQVLAHQLSGCSCQHELAIQKPPSICSSGEKNPHYMLHERNIHQRIVSLFETLARKHGRLVEGLAGAVDDKEEEGFTEVSEAVQDAAVLEEVVDELLKFLILPFISPSCRCCGWF